MDHLKADIAFLENLGYRDFSVLPATELPPLAPLAFDPVEAVGLLHVIVAGNMYRSDDGGLNWNPVARQQ